MKISLIAAVANDRAIGKLSGGLPWHLPRDIEHFRNYTDGNWLLLGRKTYHEMDGFFTNRTPVIVTRSPSELQTGKGYAVESIEAGIELAKQNEVGELIVSGGAEIYKLALPFVDTMLLTRVDIVVEGETVKFPEVNWQDWQLLSTQQWSKNRKNSIGMRLEIWQRI